MKRENIYTLQKNKEATGNGGNIPANDVAFEAVKKTVKTGVLFCPESSGNNFDKIISVAGAVTKDFPQTNLFCYIKKITKDHDLSYLSNFEIIDRKKFNIFGNLKRNFAVHLAEVHYDLFIVLGNPGNKQCKKILKVFNSTIVAGQAFENSEQLFDISIGSKDKPMNNETFYKELINYLKLLKIDFFNNMN